MPKFSAFTTFPGFNVPFPSPVCLDVDQTLTQYLQSKFIFDCLTNSQETQQALDEWKMIEVALNPELAQVLALDSVNTEVSFHLESTSHPATALKCPLPLVLSTLYGSYLRELLTLAQPKPTCFKHYFASLERYKQKNQSVFSKEEAITKLRNQHGAGCALVQFPKTTQRWEKDSYGTLITVPKEKYNYYTKFSTMLMSPSGASIQLTSSNQYMLIQPPTYDTSSAASFVDSVVKYYVTTDAPKCAELLYSITSKLNSDELQALALHIIRSTDLPSPHQGTHPYHFQARWMTFTNPSIPPVLVSNNIIHLLDELKNSPEEAPKRIKKNSYRISMLTKPNKALLLPNRIVFQTPLDTSTLFGFNVNLTEFIETYNVTPTDLLQATLHQPV